MTAFSRFAVALVMAVGCAKAGVMETGDGTSGTGKGGGSGSGTGPNGGFMLPNSGSGTGGTSASGGGTGGAMMEGCNRLDVKFEKSIPTVALLIDRSTSMYDAYPGATNRWQAVKSALLDPASGIIKSTEGEVRFGLVTYTALSKAPSCPVLEKVGIAMGNFNAINQAFGPAEPPKFGGELDKGETPTGEALAAVITELEATGGMGPKYIILATDGEPDTCPGTCTGNCPRSDAPGWPRDPNCGQDRSISTVQAAFAKGIRTFVIGIGSDVGAEHLQALANAGAGLPVSLGAQKNWLQYSCNIQPGQLKGTYVDSTTNNAKYFKPADASALARDLKGIVQGVQSCTFQLKGKVTLNKADTGTVLLNGKALKYNEGWRMNTETELEILGGSCTELQTAGQSLNVSFPCGIFRMIE